MQISSSSAHGVGLTVALTPLLWEWCLPDESLQSKGEGRWGQTSHSTKFANLRVVPNLIIFCCLAVPTVKTAVTAVTAAWCMETKECRS